MEQSLSTLCDALNQQRLLLVWADVPFPPEGRVVRDRAQLINRWQEEAKALPILPFEFSHGRRWPLVGLARLPILSLDPTDRVEATFRYAGVPLKVVRTRRDVLFQDRHNLIKLGGDLRARAGLFLSWDEVWAVSGDPDKVHVLQAVQRVVRGGVVLAMAPSPAVAFSRLWMGLVAPAIQEATRQFVIGPAEYAWPTPLIRLEAGIEETLTALADAAIPPPLELV
jgi:hypothetical protein